MPRRRPGGRNDDDDNTATDAGRCALDAVVCNRGPRGSDPQVTGDELRGLGEDGTHDQASGTPRVTRRYCSSRARVASSAVRRRS